MNNLVKNFSASIPELMESVFHYYGDKPAFHCLGTTLSYREVDRLSAAFAAYLQNHTSLQPGDRIAVQLPNLLQYPVVVFAAFRAGLVIVNVNPQYTARELKHQLVDSGAKALVVLENFADIAEKVLPETSVETVFVSKTGDLLSAPKRQVVNAVLKYIRKQIPEYSIDSAIALRSAITVGERLSYSMASPSNDALALIQYTGGTTGVSKGAMLSHGNLLSNTRQIHESLVGVVDDTGEVYVAPLPIYHIYAFQFHILCLFCHGALSVLIPDPRDTDSFVKSLKPFKFTGFLGINTLFTSLCQHQGFKNLDFSNLKSTSSGGMALTSEVAKQWFLLTGCEVSEGFGMTEASPVICANSPLNIVPGSVGRALPDTEIKVIDSDGLSLPIGEIGELCVRGPQVMSGYWQRPEETAQALTVDGWLKTGDIAVIQHDGVVKIVDRLKDMIIVSGFNVYPNEIDDVLVSHPDIIESAVIGIDDVNSGEAIRAYVVTNNNDLTTSQIRKFCREQLTGYKVPKDIVFTDQLPKSAVGKVLRRELQAAQ